MDAMNDHTIEVHDLTRRYGDLLAVDHISFAVRGGAMTGFVGANGAGKSTTMRMIVGVLALTEGQVTWAGRPITAADRRRFGYMPEERGLYPKQKIIDQLVYLARLRGVGPDRARKDAMAHLERFGLAERATDKVEALSLGNQQRVQVIAAVMAEPTALILDEPFSGLDPVAVDSMVDLLREQTHRGVPVLFSSHQLDLIDRLCDRMTILHEGRLVADGTTEELRRAGPHRHRIVARADLGWLRQTRGVDVVDLDGRTAVVTFTEQGADQAVVAEALNRGGLDEFAPVVASLSEIYREVAAA